MLFYNNITPLNSVQQKNDRVRQVTDFTFAANTHFIPVTGMEFGEAAKALPIVFVRSEDGGFTPIVMVGLQENKNMFVSSEGKWLAGYIPGYVRRYPFVLSSSEENSDQLTICIDDTYPGYNAKDGEALFQGQGKPTPFLEGVIEILKHFHAHSNLTIEFCKRLADSGILEELKGEFSMPNGEKKIKLEGLYTVSEKKLVGLDDKTVLDFFRRGELAWIHFQLSSLANLSRMVESFFAAQN